MKTTGSFNWIAECKRLEEINSELLRACRAAKALLQSNFSDGATIEGQRALRIQNDLLKVIAKAEGRGTT